MYKAITQTLYKENSLPVMVQALKCLATLVQATPFHKLKNSPGIIPGFVTFIRRVVLHSDPTIKVAALIVMECLISRTDITDEITECVGLARLPAAQAVRIHDFGEDQV